MFFTIICGINPLQVWRLWLQSFGAQVRFIPIWVDVAKNYHIIIGMVANEPNSNTLANQLADRMRCHILENGLRENDAYMTEADVAEKYQVSRSITREAVSRLRGVGILKSRQGKGLMVGKPDAIGVIQSVLPFVGRDREDLRDLMQLRSVLELGAVDLAVANATEDQIETFVELAEQYELAVNDSSNNLEQDRIELAFHGLILEMTGNKLVSGMHRVLVEFFHLAPKQVPDWGRSSTKAAWQHRAIAEAFRERDVELARSLLRQHLRHISGEDASKTDDIPPETVNQ